MSYDIYLRAPNPCAVCGRKDEDAYVQWSPTYNLRDVFDLAIGSLNGEDHGVGLRSLSGRVDDPGQHDTFRRLAPPNGWGTVKDAREVVEGLYTLAQRYQTFTWEVT